MVRACACIPLVAALISNAPVRCPSSTDSHLCYLLFISFACLAIDQVRRAIVQSLCEAAEEVPIFALCFSVVRLRVWCFGFPSCDADNLHPAVSRLSLAAADVSCLVYP